MTNGSPPTDPDKRTCAALTAGLWWITAAFRSPRRPESPSQPERSPDTAQIAALAIAVLPEPFDSDPEHRKPDNLTCDTRLDAGTTGSVRPGRPPYCFQSTVSTFSLFCLFGTACT